MIIDGRRPFSAKILHNAVPPVVRELTEGHQVKCHLANQVSARMDPVIKTGAE